MLLLRTAKNLSGFEGFEDIWMGIEDGMELTIQNMYPFNRVVASDELIPHNYLTQADVVREALWELPASPTALPFPSELRYPMEYALEAVFMGLVI